MDSALARFVKIEKNYLGQKYIISKVYRIYSRPSKANTVQSLYNTIFGVHRMDHVISEPCYDGTILQRNYRKMTILWSFSYNAL